MEIHVINLKEAVDRRKSIESQLQKLQLSYKIFDAVRGSALSEKELNELVDMEEVRKYPNWLTPNMLGCSLSHMGVYKQMCISKEEWHFVLEDDVVIDNDLENILTHIEKNGDSFKDHLVMLYGVSYNSIIELSRTPITEVSGKGIYKLESPRIGSTGAYVMHRDTAKRLVEKNEKIKVAPDTWHFFREQKALDNIYCVYPFAARPGFFESTIGYINKKSFVFKVKKLIEKYKVPVLYSLLKLNRKRIWEETSRVEFK